MIEPDFKKEIKSVNDTLVRAIKNLACYQGRGEMVGSDTTILPAHLHKFCNSDPTVRFLFENFTGSYPFWMGFFVTLTVENFIYENNENPDLAVNGVYIIGSADGYPVVFNTNDRRIYFLGIETTYESAFVTKEGHVIDSWDTFDGLFEKIKQKFSEEHFPGDPNYLHIIQGIV